MKVFKIIPRFVLAMTLSGIFLSTSYSLAANGENNGDSSGQKNITLASNNDEDASVRELLSILSETTQLATKTKLNKDYVPGMITVLRAQELKEQGIRTLWEAIGFAPGMDVSIDPAGNKKIGVRGVNDAFSSGNIKVMIDDVPVNSFSSGLASAAWNMPVEQIDRIEIIRGPGSSIHGEFAYLGVINVVTARGVTGAYAGAGSFSYYNGGAQVNYNDPENVLRLDISIHGWRTAGGDVTSGADAISGPPYNLAGISNAPGKVNLRDEYGAGSARFDYKDFSFMANVLESGGGERFGSSITLPKPSDRVAVTSDMRNAQIGQRFKISPSLDVEMKAGWSEWTDFNNHLIIAQPGFNVLGTSYPDGWYSTTFLKERRYDGGVDIKWAGLEGHKMLVNLSRSNSTIVDAWKETNVDPLTYAQSPSMQRYDGVADSIPVNNSRNITSAAIQDEIALQEDVALTATVRTDSYSDIGATVNPRLAVVWNLAEGHLLKAQYATAFRPPTIYETSLTAAIAPGASLYPETVTTDDIAYIYRSPDFMFGMDLFLSDMKNLIRNYGYQYVNDNGAQTRGVEVEVEKLVGASFKVCGNVSYADTKDQITGSPVQDSTRWLANISAMWKPVYDFSITGRYRMAGERQRYAHDTREALPGYDTLDITASYYNLLFKGLTLRGGVKNAFDKTVKYPGMVAVMGNNVLPLQPDDMQTDGRKLWVTLEYELGK